MKTKVTAALAGCTPFSDALQRLSSDPKTYRARRPGKQMRRKLCLAAGFIIVATSVLALSAEPPAAQFLSDRPDLIFQLNPGWEGPALDAAAHRPNAKGMPIRIND